MHSLATLLLVVSASILTAAQTSAATCAPESTIPNNIPQPSGAANVTACANSIPLGGTCGADEQCMDNAQCWGSTAFTIRQCGNFNAACESDSQCAYNTCNDGLCNGFIATSSVSGMTTATPSAGYPDSGNGNATQSYGSTSAYPSSTGAMQQPVGSGAQKFFVGESLLVAFAGIAAMLM